MQRRTIAAKELMSPHRLHGGLGVALCLAMLAVPRTALAQDLVNDPSADLAWQRPALERIARAFKRDGLPMFSLWRGHRITLSLGVDPHGAPGLYFVQAREEGRRL